MPLEHEIEVYEAHLGELLGPDLDGEGKFVVIHEDTIAGLYDTYEAALDVGYGRFGPGTFLARKVEREEPILYTARDVL